MPQFQNNNAELNFNNPHYIRAQEIYERYQAQARLILEAAQNNPDLQLSAIVAQYGTWAVTDFGLECLVQYYPIEKAKIRNNPWPWLLHFAEKDWVVWPDFLFAYEHAERHHFPANTPTDRRWGPQQQIGKSIKNPGAGNGLRFQVFRRDNYKCQICGRTPKSDPNVVLELDHVVAVSKGGKNELNNLQALCKECNSGKSDKPI